MKPTEKAKQLAEKCHKAQTRWDGGPYINHLVRVAENVLTVNSPPFCDIYSDSFLETLQVVAFLHDVLEDSYVTSREIFEVANNDEIYYYINLLTKHQDDSYVDYILRVKSNLVTKLVKSADINDNILGIVKSKKLAWEKKLRIEKYKLALHILNS